MMHTRSPFPRRIAPVRLVAVLSLMMAVLLSSSGATQAASMGVVSQDWSTIMLPADLGQTPVKAYVPATGHTVDGYLLDYWRANGAASVYGNPISEPFAGVNGYYSQAFENGIFQYIPERVWTDIAAIKLMPVVGAHLNERVGKFRADGKRFGGGADRRAGTWRGLNPEGKTAQTAIANGELYVETTSHTITGDFLAWYQSHEGWAYLGDPISEPAMERGVYTQYFEGAVLIQDADGIVRLAPIIRQIAGELGIDTTPVAQGDLPVYDELYFWTMDNPNPQGDPYAAGRKWIEVNVSEQTLYAWQGSTLISASLVSTGLEPNFTELGVFHVRYKMPITDMQGVVEADGSVGEVGDIKPEDLKNGEETYVVKDIPDVMYFNQEAEAFHGAYWHNNFGNPMSHGCVNLPLDFAHFLYGWAPLGTMVWVHE